MANPRRALSLNLDDTGQNFAGIATIRAALFDVLDHGDQDGQRWAFYENPHEGFAAGTFAWTEDNANTERSNFVGAVIARIAELQNPPHSGVKLENLCPRHIKMTLPRPTAMVCRMCEAERGNRLRGDCTFKNGICVECGKSEY